MTTNPLLILIINMTVVFFVLFVLELLTRGIYYIDPTRKKGVAAPATADFDHQHGCRVLRTVRT